MGNPRYRSARLIPVFLFHKQQFGSALRNIRRCWCELFFGQKLPGRSVCANPIGMIFVILSRAGTSELACQKSRPRILPLPFQLPRREQL